MRVQKFVRFPQVAFNFGGTVEHALIAILLVKHKQMANIDTIGFHGDCKSGEIYELANIVFLECPGQAQPGAAGERSFLAHIVKESHAIENLMKIVAATVCGEGR
jgi:hypothetical protein